jgi:hypothetical protein
MAALRGDIKPNLLGSTYVFKSPVSLNNIDKFLDLLRTKFDEHFGMAMPIYRNKACLLPAADGVLYYL